jgi:hypothetical protein
MQREIDNWEDFPALPVTGLARSNTHWFDQAANRCAERFVGVVMAGAPFFYVGLFLAYLAVSFGIIS